MNMKERNKEIAKKYLDGYSLEDVGKAHGISKQRVQQILKKIGIARRSEPGERGIFNLSPMTRAESVSSIIDAANQKVEKYRNLYRREQHRNVLLKKYYKKKLLAELLEA